jgi:hypothetical protein
VRSRKSVKRVLAVCPFDLIRDVGADVQEWLIHLMGGGYRSYRMMGWFDSSIHRKKSKSLDPAE